MATDTVYGLATNPLSPTGVAKIFAMKGRAERKPLPVLIGSLDHIPLLSIELTSRVKSILESLWPAPVTVILPITRQIPASLGEATLAVRLPAPAWLRSLLAATGPLTATSANLSGLPPAITAADVARLFGEHLAHVIDAGPSTELRPSTLLDLSCFPARVLRDGPVPVDVTHL